MPETPNTYREAIAYVRRMQGEAEKIRQTCEQELSLFERALESANGLCRRLRDSGYWGDPTCVANRERDLRRNMTDFTAVQFSEDVLAGVETAETILLGQGSRYGASDRDAKDARLVNLCTYLRVLMHFFSNEENHRRYRQWIADEHEQALRALLEKTAAQVAPFLKKAPAQAHIAVPPIGERVDMPGDFPASAPLPVGHYLPVDRDWVRTASDILGEATEELDYKRLILQMAQSQRTQDAFSPDLAVATAGNHLLIRQPHFSARELDDRADIPDDRPLIELYETLMLRYVGLFPRISKRIAVIQPRNLSELSTLAHQLSQTCRDLVLAGEGREGRGSDAATADTLQRLLADCRASKEFLTPPWDSIAAYNADNYRKGIWKQMTLLLIKDYPVGFDDRAVEYLRSILQEGHKFGITVVMSVCDDRLAELTAASRGDAYTDVLSYFDPRNVFTVHGYELVSRDSYERVGFRDTVLSPKKFHMQAYLAGLERYFSNSRDPAIPLETLFETSPEAVRERRANFSRVLDIPIGKSGTANRHMKLYRTGGGSPHVVIAGTTGSGKSVLLQDIIISAACHYSPDELEMYLFDFKETPKGFERYGTGFPHVKKIATQCKERDIYELLRMIRTIYTERMTRVGAAGFADIGSYNAHVLAHGGKLIPRMMVIIDEYQTITSEICLELLLEIAQKGREFGVSLIMASQSNKVTVFGNIIRQFGHRIEFKNEPIGELINHIGSRAQELNGPKGLCFYSEDGSTGTPMLLRCAYVNDEDKNEVIGAYAETIRRHFGRHPDATYRIGSVRRICRPVDFSARRGSFSPLPSAAGGFAAGHTPLFDGEGEEEAEWLETARDKYRSAESASDRGFLLRLGLGSIGLSGVEYRLDRQNPYLLLCGNAERLQSVEYSVMRSAVMAAEEDRGHASRPCVYYLDGDLQGDRRTPVYAMKGQMGDIFYADNSRAGLTEALARIHAEYECRRGCAGVRDYQPMIVMLAAFDRMVSLLAEDEGGVSLSARPAPRARTPRRFDEATLDARFAQMNTPASGEEAHPTASERGGSASIPAPPAAAGKSAAELLESLFTLDMHKYDIFLCIRLGDPGECQYLRKKLREGSLSSLIFLDRRSTHAGNRAEADRDEALAAMATYAGSFLSKRTSKLSRADIQTDYAYRLSNTDSLEFIPYEYVLRGGGDV